MAYFGENWDDSDLPIAYLITITTYGTWLHGDERRSIDTHRNFNAFGAASRPPDPTLKQVMAAKMNSREMTFDQRQRDVVRDAISEVCRHRTYRLYALSVRSNHAHVVTGAETRPEIVADSFKAYTTRKLREYGLIDPNVKPWSRGRSRRYLWKSHHVNAAIDYVTFCQGDDPFDEWYSSKFWRLKSSNWTTLGRTGVCVRVRL
jgi:REP element-mobilizing transposase RayT